MDEQTQPIRGEKILLGQLLKVLGIAYTGGEAKLYLADADIRVNGEFDNRRGRQLFDGDVVELPGGRRVRIAAGQ